jgi:gliding motility-associated-like protein
MDTLSNANGCDSIIELDLQILPEPSVDAGADQTLSCSNTLLLLQGSGSGAPFWSGPDITTPGSWDQMVALPGLYVLTVTTIDGCIAKDTLEIVPDVNSPVANAGPDGVLTCDIPSAVLSGSATPDSLLFSWSGPGITPDLVNTVSPTVFIPGTYVLVATDTVTGCVSAPDTVVIGDVRADVLAQISADGDITCLQDTVSLSSEGSSVGSSIVYVWVDPADNFFYNVNSIPGSIPGVYVLYVLDTITGCEAIDSHVVSNLVDYPPADAGDDAILDCKKGFVILSVNSGIQQPLYEYSWSGPPGGILSDSTDREILVTLPGEYIVTVIDTTNGCTSTDTVQVIDIRAIPNADAGPSQVLTCGDDFALLDAGNSSVGPNFEYLWNGPGIEDVPGLTILVDRPGWYELLVMNVSNGCADMDSVEVTMTDFLSGAAIDVEHPTCFTDSTGQILIGAISGGTPPYQYSLDGILFQDSTLFDGLAPGTYTVVIRDSLNCEWQTTIVINAGLELSLNIGPDLTLVIGDSVQLFADYSPLIDVDSIVWSPGSVLSCTHCFNPTLVATVPDTFTITATIYAGDCIAVDQLVVRVDDDYTLFVPNVFSPNDDVVNDFVSVFSNDLLAIVLEFEIFDRWGEKVFRGTDFPVNVPELGWDGRFKGQYMNPAVFVYVAKVQFSNGTVRVISGDITLVR